MIDFAALQDYIYSERIFDSLYHGLSHWRAVEFNGLMLSRKTKADIDVVRLFALFHDSKREDDGYDGLHGARGAEFAKKCFSENRFNISENQFDKLYKACSLHTKVNKTLDITIDTCFDADRLDLGRVGFKLDPKKMATEIGAKIARKSLDAGIDVYSMRGWLKTLKI